MRCSAEIINIQEDVDAQLSRIENKITVALYVHD